MLGRPYSGPAVDAWAVGVVFYAMLTGTLPFAGGGDDGDEGDGNGTQRTLRRIVEGRWKLPGGVRVGAVGRGVLGGLLCWEVGVGGRWSVGEARGWVGGGGRSAGDGGDGKEEAEEEGGGSQGQGQRQQEEVEEDEGGRGLKRAEIDRGIVKALGSLWWWVAEEDLLACLAADGSVCFFVFLFFFPLFLSSSFPFLIFFPPPSLFSFPFPFPFPFLFPFGPCGGQMDRRKRACVRATGFGLRGHD